MAGQIFLMWYDDNPKVHVTTKIAAAIEAYTDRFAVAPNLVLVNEDEVVPHIDIAVRGVTHIRRNNYWVGLEDAREA